MGDAVVRALMFTALAGLAFVPLERLFGRQRGASRPGRLADLGFATLGSVLVLLGVATLVGGVLAMLAGFSREEPLLIGIGDRTIRTALEVAAGLLVFELVGYAYHRLAHAVPWMWRLHEVHHSSERMDWLASFRQHPLEILLVTLAQNAPLVLLGLPLGSHALVLLALRLNTVFVHADLPVPRGWWSEVVATPAFHHRHHQREGAARNFSAVFPWLDRLFRTHDAAPAGPVGLATPMPRGFLGLLVAPFVRRHCGKTLLRAKPVISEYFDCPFTETRLALATRFRAVKHEEHEGAASPRVPARNPKTALVREVVREPG